LRIHHALIETSHLTDPCRVTGSGRKATTIGNYVLGDSPANSVGDQASGPSAWPDDFASIIYIDRPGRQVERPFGETDMPQVINPRKKTKIMGDRSPKSNQKKTNQKQAQADSADQKKKAAEAAKSAALKKR
jgi:hypothetical protein